MTRKRSFAYTTLFLLGLCVTLAVINPGIAALPVGFSAVFLALFAVTLTGDYAIAAATQWHRPLSFVGMMFWSVVIMGATGGPGAIVFGWIMTIAVFTLGRWRGRVVPTPASA